MGKVGQTRDVGWVRGQHAANVSAVLSQSLSGAEPARSGVESAVRGCGLWVAGVGGLVGSPDGTADKSPSRHVDVTLSTFTVLLKVAT